MAKLSTLSASTYKRVLLYGPPKAGKTQLAGELSEVFNLIWIDLEAGKDTLFSLPVEWQERIDVLSVPDTRDNPVAIELCLKLATGRKFEVCEEHGVISCSICKKAGKDFTEVYAADETADRKNRIVVFDSLTQLTNSAIAFITKGKPDGYKLEFDDWNQLGVLMDKFLSLLQQARYHVVCISHETEAELEDGKMRIVPVAGTRNYSRNVAKFFDEVIYCSVANGKHVFGSSTLFKNNIMSGSRSGSVLEKEAKPSLIPIFQGKVKLASESVNSPATNALSALEKLRQGAKK